jgi:glycosyltransferase involved in cell wall biosynthesis
LPKILAVGRLTKAKDYPTMLRAFSLVLKEIPANLLVIGDGKERKKIEQLIYDLDILDNVKLLGTQKNPFKYMNKSDVFVLSSSVEGFRMF